MAENNEGLDTACEPPSVVESDSEDEMSNESPRKPKRAKIQWQETLVNLVAAQQQQLAELSTNMASMAKSAQSALGGFNLAGDHITSTHVPTVTPVLSASFKISSFDPDKSAYPIKEWLDDCTKLKEELNASDILMIAKAGDALRHRGYRYYCDWRPLTRSWANFCEDLITAFPDNETPGARAYTAATLRSTDCDSLCDYGNQKFRAISRFHDKLPWDTILSMIEHGLAHNEVRSALRIQKPLSERDVLKLFGEYDARRTKKTDSSGPSSARRTERHTPREHSRDAKQRRFSNDFIGKCFKCGRPGHPQSKCRSQRKEEQLPDVPRESAKSKETPPTCEHCKKLGHTEANCWYKHGRPQKAFVLKK